MIHVVDYGLGNIQAFLNLYKSMGLKAARASTPEQLEGASKIVLPGVGSFDHAISKLNMSGMRPVLESLVLNDGVPILGVCVGMQILAASSEEGCMPGLNFVPGRVISFASKVTSLGLPRPHMGWNQVVPEISSPLFDGISVAPRFYFLHSYFFECSDEMNSIGTTEYGIGFTSAISSRNIYGVQFHPEKSHHAGVRLLENFAKL
ncbi:imidazole glycerol phosphate synthase subunit HisH [Polynucleobacter sp. 73C-SIWE]|uniref:imidazole glycerol phosphate synthase subunit HisH n=1 Tax=Polynucleobacter sp. 73C-SIWE TaxID=2689098 RepID=UPI001C0D508D|nr:imidazole glycerol phosphate synthase subunit HisH [Polynucleobacter sp. 73C-SIWE]MBU3578634.1 imidazole glycerol phosphate synthase subunit HisH [Polynucleobacter sp. 73C-SIWE]